MSQRIIPTDALSQHAIALGKTRSGKSSAMRLLVEEALDSGRRVSIIDPKGDWWGLRSSKSGKRGGFPVVIFGGEHADVPINERSGRAVAELVATGNRPCIIDLGGWHVGPRTRFFIDYAAGLFQLNKQPMLQVIDEVHNFVPQGKVLDPDAGKMLHWGNRLASEGAGKGIVLLSASQRPQKVHKDFVTCSETLLAFRVIHPLDRAAIKDWIDGCQDRDKGREVLESLASMPRGQAWVWSPEIGFGPQCVTFPMFRTFDSFAAPTGEETEALKGWADVDLNDVRQAMAEAVKEAEANDPKILRQKISQLERDLADARGREPEIDPQAVREQIDAAVLQAREDLKGIIRDHLQQLTKMVVSATESLTTLGHGIGAFETILEANPAAMAFPKPTRIIRGTIPTPAPQQRRSSARPPAAGGKSVEGLQPAHQRILDALAWLEQFGLTQPDRGVVAAVAGASPRSSAYMNNVSRLNVLRLISYPRDGALTLTSEGRQAANAPQGAATLDDLHDAWRQCKAFQPAHVRIIDALIRFYPNAVSRETLAEQSGASPTSSAFMNNVSRLSAMGLATYPQPGYVSAGPLLFPDRI